MKRRSLLAGLLLAPLSLLPRRAKRQAAGSHWSAQQASYVPSWHMSKVGDPMNWDEAPLYRGIRLERISELETAQVYGREQEETRRAFQKLYEGVRFDPPTTAGPVRLTL